MVEELDALLGCVGGEESVIYPCHKRDVVSVHFPNGGGEMAFDCVCGVCPGDAAACSCCAAAGEGTTGSAVDGFGLGGYLKTDLGEHLDT